MAGSASARGAMELEAGTDDAGVPEIELGWDWLSEDQWATLNMPGRMTSIAVTYQGGSWSGAVDFSGVVLDTREPAPTSPTPGGSCAKSGNRPSRTSGRHFSSPGGALPDRAAAAPVPLS